MINIFFLRFRRMLHVHLTEHTQEPKTTYLNVNFHCQPKCKVQHLRRHNETHHLLFSTLYVLLTALGSTHFTLKKYM